MRYYDIRITDPDTGKPIMPNSLLVAGSGGQQPTSISSLLPTSTPSNQITNPAALQVEFDLPIHWSHIGDVSSYVRIWGLSLADQKFAPSINGANIEIWGGMSPGYPLANPQQQGLLIKGQVFQAFGNWIGTDMTVDLFINPPTGQDTPQTAAATTLAASDGKNFVFNWMPGQSLSQAIAQTLSLALPGMKQDIQISPNLTTPYQQAGYYPTLVQFAQAVQSITAGKLGASYDGVAMACNGSTVVVWDGTQPVNQQAIKSIAFQDLLGQVTQYQPGVVTAKLVLRGDLNPGDIISFPQGLVTTTSSALTRFQNKLQFTGPYQIMWLQHWGNSRQPDAMSWNTTVWCSQIANGSAVIG